MVIGSIYVHFFSTDFIFYISYIYLVGSLHKISLKNLKFYRTLLYMVSDNKILYFSLKRHNYFVKVYFCEI